MDMFMGDNNIMETTMTIMDTVMMEEEDVMGIAMTMDMDTLMEDMTIMDTVMGHPMTMAIAMGAEPTIMGTVMMELFIIREGSL